MMPSACIALPNYREDDEGNVWEIGSFSDCVGCGYSSHEKPKFAGRRVRPGEPGYDPNAKFLSFPKLSQQHCQILGLPCKHE
jgi:Zn ribbon nucleic-acid-binding protein